MAFSCVNGVGECDGCGKCRSTEEYIIICPNCHNEILCPGHVYENNKTGEIIGCMKCIEMISLNKEDCQEKELCYA